MANAQVPWGIEAVGGVLTNAAWRSKPSYYLVASEDHMVPPAAQRTMAERAGSKVQEVKSSHAVMMSRANDVAAFIESAAGPSK
jgi:pimeloyl-ACP methyl ester carboxylesterase